MFSRSTSAVDVTASSVYLFGCVQAPPPQVYSGTQCFSKPIGNRKLFSLGWLSDMVWPFLFLLKAFLLDASSSPPPPFLLLPLKLFFGFQ